VHNYTKLPIIFTILNYISVLYKCNMEPFSYCLFSMKNNMNTVDRKREYICSHKEQSIPPTDRRTFAIYDCI